MARSNHRIIKQAFFVGIAFGLSVVLAVTVAIKPRQQQHCAFICPHPERNGPLGIDATATVTQYQALCSPIAVSFVDGNDYTMLDGGQCKP